MGKGSTSLKNLPLLKAAKLILLLLATLTGWEDALSQPAENGSQPNPIVQQAIDLYDEGRLTDAEHIALKTLDSPGSLSKLDQSELYKILAFIAIANDDEENARRHFVSALKLNPNLVADPITWSPKVRRAFSNAREDFVQILKREAEIQASSDARINRDASLRSLYLPGSGQALKGEPLRGWVIGTLFAASVATFIYAEMSLPSARDRYQESTDRSQIPDLYDDYRSLSHLAAISGGCAITIYSFAFFDALWRAPVQ